MRQFRSLDLSAYGQAFVLLFQFPQVMIGPFLAGIFSYLVLSTIPGGRGGSGIFDSFSATVYQLIGQFVTSFGLALALIGADSVWRQRSAPFAQTWEAAVRKVGDIFFATIGFGFVIYVAGMIGSFLGALGSIVLSLVAFFFFIYTLPAAAIGGIPGGAALQASLERARDNPIPTLLVTILYLFINRFAPPLIIGALLPIVFTNPLLANSVITSIVEVILVAVLNTYLAFVLAKTYADLAFGRRRW